MMPFLQTHYGNPSSVHQIGRKARSALDDARYEVAAMWQCKPSEVVFTSGGTESNNLAILGSARLKKPSGRHLVTSAIEHHAVLHTCEYLVKNEGFELSLVEPSSDGFIAPEAVASVLRDDTVLVSIMAANNEIGSIQAVSEIGALCQDRGILFHTDAVQAFGKLPFESIHQFKADLVSCCAHKFYGPKGAGALFIRSPLLPDPILFGGGHENERRAGSENLPSIVGFVEAFKRFVLEPVFEASSLTPLRDHLRQFISTLEGPLICTPSDSALCNTLSIVVPDHDSISLLAALDLEGFCASGGSACSAGSIEPSHVVKALGFPDALASSQIRFSLGRSTSSVEIETLCSCLPRLLS